MKWLIYAAVIGAALLVPMQRTDVGKLQPIEVVSIQAKDEQIILRTELGDLGEGKTVAEALDNMKQTAAGIIYLDTAEYLLIGRNAESDARELAEYLRGDVRICEAEADIPLEESAPYLDSHRPKLCLDEWNGEPINEELICKDKKYDLLKKE